MSRFLEIRNGLAVVSTFSDFFGSKSPWTTYAITNLCLDDIVMMFRCYELKDTDLVLYLKPMMGKIRSKLARWLSLPSRLVRRRVLLP